MKEYPGMKVSRIAVSEGRRVVVLLLLASWLAMVGVWMNKWREWRCWLAKEWIHGRYLSAPQQQATRACLTPHARSSLVGLRLWEVVAPGGMNESEGWVNLDLRDQHVLVLGNLLIMFIGYRFYYYTFNLSLPDIYIVYDFFNSLLVLVRSLPLTR